VIGLNDMLQGGFCTVLLGWGFKKIKHVINNFLVIQFTPVGKRCVHAHPFQGRMNSSVGLDCRHPGDSHPSRDAHGHIISVGGKSGTTENPGGRLMDFLRGTVEGESAGSGSF